jgi:tetratricopeptide (TPR) repeat protein
VAQKKKLSREENVPQQPQPDAFQSAGADRIENLSKKLEGKGRPILYGLLGLLAVALVGGLIYAWSQRTANAAQAALGRAIDISEAQVTASPAPNNQKPTFPTEKERAEKAIAAFEEVAAKYGSPHKEKAQYFIAVNRLKIDREAGMRELESLNGSGNNEVAGLSKFALAEARAAAGRFDEAANLYNDLLKQNSRIIADETLNFALANVYEKQGKKPEAADIYFNLAKTAREAKDASGKPAIVSATAREAAQKLEKLDPAKHQQLPPEPSGAAF